MKHTNTSTHINDDESRKLSIETSRWTLFESKDTSKIAHNFQNDDSSDQNNNNLPSQPPVLKTGISPKKKSKFYINSPRNEYDSMLINKYQKII